MSLQCRCMLSIIAKEKRVIGNGIHFRLAGMSAGVLTADHQGDISPQGHLQLRINQKTGLLQIKADSIRIRILSCLTFLYGRKKTNKKTNKFF
jgi:hypothetical protein